MGVLTFRRSDLHAIPVNEPKQRPQQEQMK